MAARAMRLYNLISHPLTLPCGYAMQVWQQMQAHMAALISQQQQQLQMGGMQPAQFQQPAQFSPFMPMSPSSAVGSHFPFPTPSPAAAGAMPFPMSIPGSPSGIDPATWQGAVQAHVLSYSKAPPSTAVSMVGAAIQQQHEVGSGGTVQYFGGTSGEVYCCFQGRWFQVRPEAAGVQAGGPLMLQGGGKAVMELEADAA